MTWWRGASPADEIPGTFRFLGLPYLRPGSRSAVGPYLLALADQLPRMLFGSTPETTIPDLGDAWITVFKLDHLGDLLMATPFLCELRRQRPRSHTQLVVGSWSLPLARILERGGLCDEVVTLDAATHNRMDRGLLRKLRRHSGSHRTALAAVKSRAPVAAVDLRVFTSGGLLLARQARVPFRIGFGLRGWHYTMHRTIPYDRSRSLGQLFLDALPLLGLERATYFGPDASALVGGIGESTDQNTEAAGASGSYVVVHAASPVSAKCASAEAWRSYLQPLARRHTIVAVGTEADRSINGALAAWVPPERWLDLTGRTPFESLVRIVRGAAGGVTIDSVVAHLLLAFRRPSVVLMMPGASARRFYPDETPTISFADGRAAATVLDGEQFAASLE